jgi:acyl-CoA thioester hydrolase
MVVVRDRVRFVETDMMGVVHHANYLRWFEMGRVEYLRRAGVYLLDLMAAGILFPIMDVSCAYHAPARFDDCLAIETTMGRSVEGEDGFHVRVVREADGVLLATGRTRNAFTDEAGKVIRLPAEYYGPLQAMFAGEAEGTRVGNG